MLIRTSLPALLACLSITPGLAADWHEVGTVMERNTTVFVDHDSLKVDHDTIVQGWVRFDYSNPQASAGQQLSRQTSLRMVNCESKRYWITEGWSYPSSGGEPQPLNSRAQEWKLAPPDTEAEMAVKALCAETQSVFGWVWGILKATLSIHNN